MNTDAQPAAPSAAPVPTPSFADFEAAQNALDRGAQPKETAAPPADPAPAQPEEQAASTDATPEPSEAPKPPKKGAESRIQELLRDRSQDRDRIARLEAQIEALRTPQPKPDATPAPSPAPATFPSYETWIQEQPDGTYEDYLDARADFRVAQAVKADREQRDAEARTRETQERHQRATQSATERESKFAKRLKDAGINGEDLHEELDHLRPSHRLRDPESGQFTAKPSGYNALADQLLESDVAPQIMRHFSDHPEDMHRIARLMPLALMREFARLELRFTTDDKPAATPPKTVTSAPPPPDTLGKRPAASGDPLESAVGRRDFRAFEAESNQRDIAAKRRW